MIAIAALAIPKVGLACNQTTGELGEKSLASSTINSHEHNVGLYERINSTTFVLTDSYYDPNATRLPNDVWFPSSGNGGGGGGGGGGYQITCENLDELETVLVTAQMPGGGGWISGNWIVRVNVSPSGGGGGGGGVSYSDTPVGSASGDDQLTCSSSQGQRNASAASAISNRFGSNVQMRAVYSVEFAPGDWQNFQTRPAPGGGFLVVPVTGCQ